MNKLLLILISTFSLIFSAEIPINGGNFEMGNSNGGDDDRPIHNVVVSSFKIDKNEVTNREYNECVKSGKCVKPSYEDNKCYAWSNKGLKKLPKVPARFKEDNKPVVCVSWYSARKYCASKGKKLPTEAQWEYAATNGGKVDYSIGTLPTTDKINYRGKDTKDVGSYKSGAYQLNDMCGNVWEWVNDRYERDYYRFSDKKDPKGPQVGRFRVIRGGGWYSGSKQVSSRNRHWFAPETPEISIGFRCAK